MTISHSEGAGRIDHDFAADAEQICEGCEQIFIPITDEPLCRDCVRELFESSPVDPFGNKSREQDAGRQ